MKKDVDKPKNLCYYKQADSNERKVRTTQTIRKTSSKNFLKKVLDKELRV